MNDDRVICDLADGAIGHLALAVAHDLGLFRALAGGPRTLEGVSEALGLAPHKCETLLILGRSRGLVDATGAGYVLTQLAREYLAEESPTYAGALLELMPPSFPELREAFVDDDYRGSLMARVHDDDTLAREFTRIMHGHSAAPALAWPSRIDLGDCRRMLDVGGGSGAHSIEAARRWPQLRATVLDAPSVCAAADVFIAASDVCDRVNTAAFDMWSDAFPAADVHFYSDVFHNWRPAECRTLARRSFDALPPDGRIVVHEMLYDDDKSGPFTVAASSVSMLIQCDGQQFSGRELTALLEESGFVDTGVIPTFGYWSVVTGRKA